MQYSLLLSLLFQYVDICSVYFDNSPCYNFLLLPVAKFKTAKKVSINLRPLGHGAAVHCQHSHAKCLYVC